MPEPTTSPDCAAVVLDEDYRCDDVGRYQCYQCSRYFCLGHIGEDTEGTLYCAECDPYEPQP